MSCIEEFSGMLTIKPIIRLVLQKIKKKIQYNMYIEDKNVYLKEGINIWKLIRSTSRKLEEYEKCWKKEEWKVNMGRYKSIIILI